MNKLNSLTWKYFLEQKVKEIIKFIKWLILGLVGLILALFLLVLLGKLLYIIFGSVCYGIDCIFDYGVAGIEGLIGLFLIGFIFYSLVCQEWIKPNWKKARERAKKKLKIERKGK